MTVYLLIFQVVKTIGMKFYLPNFQLVKKFWGRSQFRTLAVSCFRLLLLLFSSFFVISTTAVVFLLVSLFLAACQHHQSPPVPIHVLSLLIRTGKSAKNHFRIMITDPFCIPKQYYISQGSNTHPKAVLHDRSRPSRYSSKKQNKTNKQTRNGMIQQLPRIAHNIHDLKLQASDFDVLPLATDKMGYAIGLPETVSG